MPRVWGGQPSADAAEFAHILRLALLDTFDGDLRFVRLPTELSQ